MPNSTEEAHGAQLAQERARTRKKAKPKKAEPGININPAEFMLVGTLAIVADALDALDLTGFGVIIARVIDLPVLALLWLWRINKHISSPQKTKKNPTFKMLLFALGEISPAGILPFWTAFVIYTWWGEKKAGRMARIGIKKLKK